MALCAPAARPAAIQTCRRPQQQGWLARASPGRAPAAGAAASRFGRRLRVRASLSADPSLITLPVFPLPNVLHPTQEGVLSVFEPRYLQLFRDLLAGSPGERGRGTRFVHVLSPGAAPPALLETAVGGLPRVGCCAEVQEVQERPDGNLIVRYCGARRVQLLMLPQEEPYVVAAAEWYDDEPVAELDPTVDVLEREAAKLLQEISKLAARVEPGGGGLPEAILKYRPPATAVKKTSYDTLKAAGHRAADHIDMWRRHGSVYKTSSKPAAAAADPYEAIREALGKGRRQELFSFAAAQLLVMGTPERAALLLSQDTGARLNYVLAALRPYMLELQAKASLKRGLE